MPKRKPDRSERSEAVNLIYEHGFDAGLRAGSENSRKRAGEAYRLGYNEGYEEGWRDGYSKGDEDGYRQGAEDFETNRRKGLANPERQGNGCMVYRSAK